MFCLNNGGLRFGVFPQGYIGGGEVYCPVLLIMVCGYSVQVLAVPYPSGVMTIWWLGCNVLKGGRCWKNVFNVTEVCLVGDCGNSYHWLELYIDTSHGYRYSTNVPSPGTQVAMNKTHLTILTLLQRHFSYTRWSLYFRFDHSPHVGYFRQKGGVLSGTH